MMTDSRPGSAVGTPRRRILGLLTLASKLEQDYQRYGNLLQRLGVKGG